MARPVTASGARVMSMPPSSSEPLLGVHQAREQLRQLARARAAAGRGSRRAGRARPRTTRCRPARVPDSSASDRFEARSLPAARQLRRVDQRLHLGRRHLARRVNCSTTCCVLDLDVEALLVPVDQLLHRAGQVLVGGDHRHQRADVEAADDHQVAADGVEQERRHLRQEVVEELDQELALVELEADAEDPAQARGDLGALVVRGVVGVDLDRAVDGLGDAPGERARGELALAAEHQQALAQPGDDDRLHRHHRERDQAERPVLVQDEEHRRQRLAAEEQRRDQRLADEAAERLDLVLDHGRHLGRLDAAEARQREAQDVVVQRVAQAAQHALAHPALHGVDAELEPAVERRSGRGRSSTARTGTRRRAELAAPRKPVVAIAPLREAAALDRLVDDGLGQVERRVVDHHRQRPPAAR